MIILALDIATNTGVAVGQSGSNPTCWSVDLGKGKSEDLRFSRLLSLTSTLITEHTPDLVAIEAPIGGRDTSHLLVGLAACVRGCVANRKLPLVSYHSSTIRKHFVGRAITTRDFPGLSKAKAKTQIKAVVMRQCQLLGIDAPDHDAADAAALFDYACAINAKGFQSKPAGGLFNG